MTVHVACFEIGNLGFAYGADVVAGLKILVPLNRPRQRAVEIEPRLPVEAGLGLVAVQTKKACFVRLVRVRRISPASAIGPQLTQSVGQPLDRFRIIVVRSEVPGLGKRFRILVHVLGQRKIAVQRFKHMLPGASRSRVSNCCFVACHERANQVRNETVFGPVATADHISGTGTGNRYRERSAKR